VLSTQLDRQRPPPVLTPLCQGAVAGAPASVARRWKSGSAGACCDARATGATRRARWSSGVWVAAGASRASTAPRSRPGVRTPRPAGTRRLSRRTCPANQRWQWVTLCDPWPAWPVTHDYSRVTTPDYCSFQPGPLSGSALKIKHHQCRKILRRNNWIKLTLWLKLCRKSLQCLIVGQRVTSTDTWPTQICWPTWPVTRWPIVISASNTRVYI